MGKDLNRFRGCLVGGAVGDALGYAVADMSAEEIRAKHGERGIRSYEHTDGRAVLSSETQMMLYTANGLLAGSTIVGSGGRFFSYPVCLTQAYRDWYKTQQADFSVGDICWLNNVPEMNRRRSPDPATLEAIGSGRVGSVTRHINDNRSSAALTRVPPVGLYLQGLGLSLYDVDMIAAEAAAITHGHPMAYMAAAAIAQIIGYSVNMPDQPLQFGVMSAKHALRKLFAKEARLEDLLSVIDRALELSAGETDEAGAISSLGEGFVAEDCLGIALYCALRHCDDFEEAVAAAVNHGGNSAACGALTGSILGAYRGLEAIPEKYIRDLELREVILDLADDLYSDCPDGAEALMSDALWVSKYVDRGYVPGMKAAFEEKREEVPEEDRFDEVLDNQISIDEIIDEREIEQERRRKQEAALRRSRQDSLEQKASDRELSEKAREVVEFLASFEDAALQQGLPDGPKDAAVQQSFADSAKVQPSCVFYHWKDPSYGGYDVLICADEAAFKEISSAFEGCRMDAIEENGRRYFLLDSGFDEITPLRKREFLHPEGESPVGDEIEDFSLNLKLLDYRVYTDKELAKR
ncbi:MAG TPA: ADP-ribosylglycohydrolase family protein [Bacillota bacterium]|nr:ADP-ribosylglycohydrolase family protein [Bacillota bacterium]